MCGNIRSKVMRVRVRLFVTYTVTVLAPKQPIEAVVRVAPSMAPLGYILHISLPSIALLANESLIFTSAITINNSSNNKNRAKILFFCSGKNEK
jgi:hypothetical protein